MPRNSRTRPAVSLRPTRPDDVDAFHHHETDPAASAMAGVKPRPLGAHRAVWRRLLESGDTINRTVLVGGEVAGRISCFDSHGQWEVGYWIDSKHWGRGVAGRALSLMLGEVTGRPLHARVWDRNPASIRVLERAGFRLVGQSDEPETDRYMPGLVFTFRLDDPRPQSFL